MDELEGFVQTNEEDSWRWKLGEEGRFSVKSLYSKLEDVFLGENRWPEEERKVFRQIWKSGAPSKVMAFSWKLLLFRIPTRVNLEVRNCLPPEEGANCFWCVSGRESSIHIFLHCDMAREIWLWWTNRFFLIPPNFFIHWECWSAGGFHMKIRRGWRMIWQATMWVIWKARNDRFFNIVVKGVEELVDEIQVLSWRWAMGRMDMPICMFYEWVWCPEECLRR